MSWGGGNNGGYGGGGYSGPGHWRGGYHNYRGGYNRDRDYYEGEEQGGGGPQFGPGPRRGGYGNPPPPGFFPGPPPSHGYGGFQGFGGYGGYGGGGGGGYGGWDGDYGSHPQGGGWGKKERGEYKPRSSSQDHPHQPPEDTGSTAKASPEQEAGKKDPEREAEDEKKPSAPVPASSEEVARTSPGSVSPSSREVEQPEDQSPAVQPEPEKGAEVEPDNGEQKTVEGGDEKTPAHVESPKPNVDSSKSDEKEVAEESEVSEEIIQEEEKITESEYDFDTSLAEDDQTPTAFASPPSSRRKQSTPTKKPVAPGESSTVLITHHGVPAAPDTPDKSPPRDAPVPAPVTTPAPASTSSTPSLRAFRKPRKSLEPETPKKNDDNKNVETPNDSEFGTPPSVEVVKKKRGRPVGWRKYKSDSDTDTETPKQKTQRKRRGGDSEVPDSSPNTQKTPSDASSQRRKSKGEMKAFSENVSNGENSAEEIPKVKEGVTERTDQENNEHDKVYSKVENELEEMFSGVTDSGEDKDGVAKSDRIEPMKEEKEDPKSKKGRKAKTSRESKEKPLDISEQVAKIPSSSRERSKRHSAQKACLNLHETSDDEDYFKSLKEKAKSSANEDASSKSNDSNKTVIKKENLTEKESKAKSLTQDSSSKSGGTDKIGTVKETAEVPVSEVPENETSVERRVREVREKTMRESLLSKSDKFSENSPALTESDKESEEKKAELIQSMMKSIESSGGKKGKKKKNSKEQLNESSEADVSLDVKKDVKPKRSRRTLDLSTESEDKKSIIGELQVAAVKAGDNSDANKVNGQKNLRSRRSRASEDSINQLIDSPAGTPRPSASEETPSTPSSNDVEVKAAAEGGNVSVTEKSEDSQNPPRGRRSRRRKSDTASVDKEPPSKSTNIEVTEESNGPEEGDKKADPSSHKGDTERIESIIDQYDPLLQSSTIQNPSSKKDDENGAVTTKKFEIKLRKVDIEDKTPLKRTRKSLSGESNEEPKTTTTTSETKRASRRTRLTRSDDKVTDPQETINDKSSDSLENGSEPSVVKSVETAPSENSVKKPVVDLSNVDTALDKPCDISMEVRTEAVTDVSDVEKSPKKRGRPVGWRKNKSDSDTDRKSNSKSKKKVSKSADENVDSNNKTLAPAKKKKNMSQVESLLDRFKGPFVHIDGSFRSPNYVNVINSHHDSLKPCTVK